MYVGVISDTHGVFSREFAEFLAPVDVIWHAGDWGGSLGFVQQIRDLGKPVVGVYGNCDGLDIREEFPEYQFFREEGLGVLITHIGGSPGHYYPRAQQLLRACKPDIFVCGHSHILKVQWDGGGVPPAPAGGAAPFGSSPYGLTPPSGADGPPASVPRVARPSGGTPPAASHPGFLYMNPGAAGLQGWQVVRTALRFKLGPAASASAGAASSASASAGPAGQISDLEVFNLPRS